jgi:hypothetical protein
MLLMFICKRCNLSSATVIVDERRHRNWDFACNNDGS